MLSNDHPGLPPPDPSRGDDSTPLSPLAPAVYSSWRKLPGYSFAPVEGPKLMLPAPSSSLPGLPLLAPGCLLLDSGVPLLLRGGGLYMFQPGPGLLLL